MANSQEIVQIDLINKGLTTLNATLDQTASKYLTIVKNINSSTAVIQQQTATTTNLAAAQKATAAAQTELDKQNKALADSTKKLQGFDAALYEQLQKNNKALADAKKAVQDKLKADQAEEGSLVRMRQKLSDLTKEYDRTGNRTAAAAAEINNLSRQIQSAEFATNRHQRNVGNYADAISGLPGPIGAAASAVQNMVQKFAAFGPVGTLIGGAILAIGAPLAAFFTQSEKGVEMMERKVAGFKAAMGILGGELIKSGEKMAESFDKTGEKGKTFWTFLMTALNPGWAAVGMKMDMAAIAAEKYTGKLQELEDQERALIVPRSEANYKIKEAMLLYNDESKSLTNRMNGLRSAIDLENKTADTEIIAQQNRIANLRIINDEKEKAGQLRDEDSTLLQQAIAKEIDLQTESAGRKIKTEKRINSAKDELLKQGQQAIKDAQAKVLETIETANKQEVQLINQKHIDGISSESQYQAELINQEYAFLRKKLSLYKSGSKEYEDIQLTIQQMTIKSNDDIEKFVIDFEKNKQDLSDETLKNSIDNNIKEVDAEIEKINKIKEAEKKAAEDAIELENNKREKMADIASEAINGIFDLGSAKRDEELSALDKEKEKKLSNKNLTEQQKLKIEEEYDKKAAVIKRKQATADKLQALFNIALSTAMGAANAASKVVTLPLVPFIIALGAVQLALAAAQPIPKFKHGTKDSPMAGIFGEAGRELMALKSGELAMADKPTYFEGSKFKGARIFSNPETEQLIKMGDRSGGRQMTDDRLLNEMIRTRKAIESKPIAIYDKDHRAIGQGNSHYQEIYVNRLLRNN